jgi:hypothetical protein
MSRRAATNRTETAVLKAFDLMMPSVSWDRWRVLIKSASGLPLDEHESAIFRACTGRMSPPNTGGRFISQLVAIIGRRGGKTRAIAWLAAYLAGFVDYSSVLVPGEVGVVVCMAPSKVQAGIAKSYIEAFIDSQPILQRMVVRRTNDAVDLATPGGTIRILVVSASFKLSRGFTCVAFIGDEWAFLDTDSDAANPDKEIYRAVLPALATTHGPAILISTPYAPTGLIHELHEKWWGREDDDTLVWVADSLTMNPLLDPKLIERAYETDAEAASAEYGARFRSDLSSLFSPEALSACVVPGRHELLPVAGVVYSAFCDPSGGSSDAFAVGIAHKDASGLVILDLLREWRSPFDPAIVTAECADTLKRYGMTTVVGDRYSAEWIVSAFKAHGITYQTSEQTKSELFLEALPLVNAGHCQLLDNARLLGQFAGLQRRTGSSGRDSVDHKRGAHDDAANAAAGALTLATHATGRLMLPANFTSCNRELSDLPPLPGRCYLFGGVGRPPADECCRGCTGNAFVRSATASHLARTGESVDIVQFYRAYVQLPERVAWAAFYEQSRKWADGMGL